MSQPPGFIDHVCKLQKAVYGLKQASHTWYDELRTFLMSNGFKPTLSNSSLIILNTTSTPLYLIVYVDDIIVTGENSTHLNTFTQTLSTQFSLKDLGALSYFLGAEVIPHPQGLFLSQSKYIHDILHRAQMLNTKPVSTPLHPSTSIILTNDTHPPP